MDGRLDREAGMGVESMTLGGGERGERSEWVDDSAEGRFMDSFFMFRSERGFCRGCKGVAGRSEAVGEDRVECEDESSSTSGLI